ncbi:MAG: tRNA (adenosine(37)-N6)-dimethylallyltransferase MiaA [Chitinophagales bacterium]|nr:tRNA (adenosine(37)-N6)-dimethylallyltransferase MiaA [Chitinophagales bacterium]
MNHHPHRIIVIAGPTAVGKTDVAIAVAKHLQVPILSFDSRQCYHELSIGVARPHDRLLQQVPHYFIADHSIHEPVTAAYYEQYATKQVAELTARYGQVVLVGGTGLYWKAFWEGLDAIPAADPAIRTEIISHYQQKGLAWLQASLAELDPLYAASGEMLNPQRMMRALEVVRATGKSIVSFQKGANKSQPYQAIGIGLQLPRPELNLRIGQRVENMIEDGLLKEVQSLLEVKDSITLKTVGYKEIFEYLSGQITFEQAVEQIKLNTRQYAKRQMTWFKKDPFFTWFSPDQLDEMMALL